MRESLCTLAVSLTHDSVSESECECECENPLAPSRLAALGAGEVHKTCKKARGPKTARRLYALKKRAPEYTFTERLSL